MPRKPTSSSKSTRKKSAASDTRKPAAKKAKSSKAKGAKAGRYTSSRLSQVETQQYTTDLLVPDLFDDDDDVAIGHGQQVRDARERYRQVTQQINPAQAGGKGKGGKGGKGGGVGLGTGILNGIFNRVRQLKAKHPELAVELDLNEWKIRQRLQNIRSILTSAELEEEDRELFIVLEVNYVQRMCEEILVDPTHDPDDIPEPTPAGKSNRRSAID